MKLAKSFTKAMKFLLTHRNDKVKSAAITIYYATNPLINRPKKRKDHLSAALVEIEEASQDSKLRSQDPNLYDCGVASGLSQARTILMAHLDARDSGK